MTDRSKRRPANPVDGAYAQKLLLPSFRTSVTRSDPSTVTIQVDQGMVDFSTDSGDAFSVSYLRESSDATIAEQNFAPSDHGYLKRILLYILYEEEYERIEEHHGRRNSIEIEAFFGKYPTHRESVLPGQEVDRASGSKAQVRLTDLRLAEDIKPVDLKRELRSTLRELLLPPTTEGVIGWKWETLGRPKGLRKPDDLAKNDKWLEEEQARIKAVSFAAAALLLLVDLDARRLEEATHDDLLERVVNLAGALRHLINKLDDSVSEVLQLIAGRKSTLGGRPPKPDARYYVALVLYRMGRPAKEVAPRVGIRAPGKRGSKEPAPKNWQSNLRAFVRRGLEVEKRIFPEAAAVFARRDEKRVKAKAAEVYRHYLEQENWEKAGEYVGGVGIGDDLLNDSLQVDKDRQLYAAYAQLGACLDRAIDPVPNTTSAVRFHT